MAENDVNFQTIAEEMLSDEDVKGLKHIIVECVTKDGAGYRAERGLFKGLKTVKNNDICILLEKSSTEVHLLRLGPYTISTVMVYSSTKKEHIFFKKSEKDQENAADLLGNLLVILEKAKITENTDKYIVDTNKYKEVPSTFISEKDTKNWCNKGGGDYTPYNDRSYNSAGSKNYTYDREEADRQDKLKKTPVFIERKNIPDVEVLNKMRDAVSLIRENKYQHPETPTFVCDTEEEEEKNKNTSTEDDDKKDTNGNDEMEMFFGNFGINYVC